MTLISETLCNESGVGQGQVQVQACVLGLRRPAPAGLGVVSEVTDTPRPFWWGRGLSLDQRRAGSNTSSSQNRCVNV